MVKMSMPKFEKALKNSGGVITLIAKRIGITRTTLYLWMRKHPETQAMLDQEREVLIDHAEEALINKLDNGVDWAIKYVLGTLGKSRGWVEKPEFQFIAKQSNMNVNIELEKLLKVTRDGAGT
jgi:transposase-like protein